jgi:membrane associated rhomboid family serine protease
MATPGQSTSDPTPAEVLRWVAESAPELWFPSRHAAETATPRDALDAPLWVLRQAGLVQVGDWVREAGQGFRLTPAGEAALAAPNPVPVPPPANQPPQDPIPADPDELHHSPTSEYALGESARRSLLDPAPVVVTPVLLVLNVGWFLYGGVIAFRFRAVSDYLQGSNHPVIGPILVRIGAVSGPELLDGEWWRLLTSCFVHVGLVHLLCNMVTLGLLGAVAEGVWGRWRFTVIYLLSGLAGSVTAMALRPQTEAAGMPADLLLGGASGGLWGLTTAVVAWLVKHLRHLPPDVGSEWVRKLLVVAVMNGAISFFPGVSLESHLGGGAGGLFVALCLARIRGDRRETATAVVGLLLLAAAFAALLTVAVARSDDWREVKERYQRKAPPTPPTPADARDRRP